MKNEIIDNPFKAEFDKGQSIWKIYKFDKKTDQYCFFGLVDIVKEKMNFDDELSLKNVLNRIAEVASYM